MKERTIQRQKKEINKGMREEREKVTNKKGRKEESCIACSENQGW
jgi:hypothetical protein